MPSSLLSSSKSTLSFSAPSPSTTITPIVPTSIAMPTTPTLFVVTPITVSPSSVSIALFPSTISFPTTMPAFTTAIATSMPSPFPSTPSTSTRLSSPLPISISPTSVPAITPPVVSWTTMLMSVFS